MNRLPSGTKYRVKWHIKERDPNVHRLSELGPTEVIVCGKPEARCIYFWCPCGKRDSLADARMVLFNPYFADRDDPTEAYFYDCWHLSLMEDGLVVVDNEITCSGCRKEGQVCRFSLTKDGLKWHNPKLEEWLYYI